jgi:hypothetical protein
MQTRKGGSRAEEYCSRNGGKEVKEITDDK